MARLRLSRESSETMRGVLSPLLANRTGQQAKAGMRLAGPGPNEAIGNILTGRWRYGGVWAGGHAFVG